MSKTNETKIVHKQAIDLDNVFMMTLLMITLFGQLSIFYKLIN